MANCIRNYIVVSTVSWNLATTLFVHLIPLLWSNLFCTIKHKSFGSLEFEISGESSCNQRNFMHSALSPMVIEIVAFAIVHSHIVHSRPSGWNFKLKPWLKSNFTYVRVGYHELCFETNIKLRIGSKTYFRCFCTDNQKFISSIFMLSIIYYYYFFLYVCCCRKGYLCVR